MRITGGTFFLNSLALDYPIMQWAEAALLFCSEIIMIDMGSKDGTRRALRSRFGNKVRIISEPWQFIKTYHEGIPRNRILKEASNPWIYLTDCDEFLHENDIEKVVKFTERKDIDIIKLPIMTFYGSCSVLCKKDRRSRFAFIRKSVGFQFGPTRDKASYAADTLKLGMKTAKSVGRWLDSNIPLYDYGRCRGPKARLGSIDFFVKQDQVRRGLEPIGMTGKDSNGMGNKVEDYILPYPDFSNKKYQIWRGQHPSIMLKWIQKHWKSHGWEV